MAPVAVMHFADRLAEAVERKGSQLVVGLDPVLAQLPEELRGEGAAAAFERFCCGIVDAVAASAVAVKPQSAFFEALGADGVRAFERVCDYARAAGLLVIADVKRGDIGSTSAAYAEAFVRRRGDAPPLADCMTVSPYLGGDSIAPFLDACRDDGAGLFCLVKTSNPGGADVQDATLADGRPLWQHVAGLVDAWGSDLVG
jgi:orotidine-5'-phosphate decarboxylase